MQFDFRTPLRRLMARPVAFGAAILAGVLLIGLAVTAGCQLTSRPFFTAPSPARTAAEPQAQAQPQPPPQRPSPALREPTRAVWVARFHYRSPEDVQTIIRNCARLGLNTVLWQVRGEGTVAYRSQLEPWSREFDYRDPGFDPLAIAIEVAHQNGVRLVAWVNTMPGWNGKEPPPMPNQLYNAHPDWFLRDDQGRGQKLDGHYVVLNPCLPQVRDYLAAVIDELVANYDIDGVHLDYIRYAWDTTPKARQRFPRDAQTLALFAADTGQTPDNAPAVWDKWRADQLTRLVAGIRETMRQRRPNLPLTAAVWGSAQRGYEDYLQSGPHWLHSGLLDAVYPMSYTDKLATFADYVEAYRAVGPGDRVIPGVGVYKHETPPGLAEQLDYCLQTTGEFALFSYDSLHATAGDRNQTDPAKLNAKNAQRAQRRELLQRIAPAPPLARSNDRPRVQSRP